MPRRSHDDHNGMKVWLSRSEADDLLNLVDDDIHWIALALDLRCGLRSTEIVGVAPDDMVDGPAGTVLRVREEITKGDKSVRRPSPRR